MTAIWFVLALVACSAPHAPAPSAPYVPARSAVRSRVSFVQAIAAVSPGMTANSVLAALGPPDDILTKSDGIVAARTVEVWRYGARKHRGFATLGSIHIQEDRTVQYVFGHAGSPPLGFDEEALQDLLEQIDSVPSYNDELDPQTLIQTVNALVPLGKTRAIAAIDEYLRVSSHFEDRGRDGVFLLDRVLFDVPASGVMPPMLVGTADRAQPADPRRLSRLPMVIVDDIPLKLVTGYTLAGKPQQPETDIDWFRTHGTMRATALKPPSHPLDVIDAFVEDTLTKLIAVDDNVRRYIYVQALRLVGSAVPPGGGGVGDWLPIAPELPLRWATARANVAKVDPIWNATQNKYTRPDGSIIPSYPWHRTVWDLALPAARESTVTCARLDENRVFIDLRVLLRPGGSIPAGAIQVFDMANVKIFEGPFKRLTPPEDAGSAYMFRYYFKLPIRTKVRLVFVQPDRKIVGPVLLP